MATTDLKLEPPGSLPEPGPVGRIVRLLLGLLCSWYVSQLLAATNSLITSDGHVVPVLWHGILPGLLLISYVINIGFSRSWGKRPAIVSAAVLSGVALVSYLTSGSVDSQIFATLLWVWELYLFSHLGLCFFVSAAIATPGCEMRALHDLYSRVTGKPLKLHRCPVGPLHPIDQWEARRSV